MTFCLEKPENRFHFPWLEEPNTLQIASDEFLHRQLFWYV